MNGWAYSIDGKSRKKETEILDKKFCLSATLFTTGTSLGSNPELCCDRTSSNCQSHATTCYIIFRRIYRELFSHTNIALLLHKSL